MGTPVAISSTQALRSSPPHFSDQFPTNGIHQVIAAIDVLFQVFAALISPFCITYHDQAGLRIDHTGESFNITIKYPFHYDNTTAVYTDEDNPPKFNFDPAIQVCAQLFVAMVIVTGVAAFLVVLLACSVHRTYSQARKLMVTVSTTSLIAGETFKRNGYKIIIYTLSYFRF